MTAAAIKKIINERLGDKTVILSLLHLHVESYIVQQGKQRSWLLGALRGFLCGGCHRNGVLSCVWEANNCGDICLLVQQGLQYNSAAMHF